MDWDTFIERWNARRLEREAKELRRAERVATVVLWSTAALAVFIVFQVVWGWMA